MTANVQSWGTDGQAGNENDFPSCIGDCASSSEDQNPHGQAEAAKETANAFGNILEQESAASGNHASKTCSDEIAALGGIGDWSMHYEFNQDRDCQGEDIGS